MTYEVSVATEFGVREAGRDYVLRNNAYALICDNAGNLAVVRTRKGCFLPGGGANADETPEQTVLRAVLDECGLDVTPSALLCAADQFVHVGHERAYVRKRCLFFKATLNRVAGKGAARDQQLLWLPPTDAAACMRHESHAWAVRQF